MNFNLANSLVLAGIIQGLVFSTVVFSSKKYHATVTRMLTALILCFSLDNLQYYLEDIGLISESELLGLYFIPFELLSGPFLMLYGWLSLDPEKRLTVRQFMLFAPFALALLFSTGLKVYFFGQRQSAAAGMAFTSFEEILEYVAIVIDVSVMAVLLIKVDRFRRRHPNGFADFPQLKWFRTMLALLSVLLLVWVVVAIADYYFGTEYWYVLYIGMSVVIYWMGHVGIFHYGSAQQKKRKRGHAIQQSVVPAEAKNEHIAQLRELIEKQKRFRDPQISLDAVATELQISKSHLSRLINSELEMGFPDYLNSLRVNEAKAYLNSPEYNNYTLLAIGLESGFNSKTTFHTAFKKMTGMTPSEFRKAHAMID